MTALLLDWWLKATALSYLPNYLISRDACSLSDSPTPLAKSTKLCTQPCNSRDPSAYSSVSSLHLCSFLFLAISVSLVLTWACRYLSVDTSDRQLH